MRRRLHPTLAAVVLLAAVAVAAAAQLTGAAQPTLKPSTCSSTATETMGSNALSGPCRRTNDENDPSLVGWRNDNLVIGTRSSLCSYDPATNRWTSFAGSRGGGYATDGRTLAGDTGNGAVSLIDERGNGLIVPLPAWADNWNF